jgi:hypothetical protein
MSERCDITELFTEQCDHCRPAKPVVRTRRVRRPQTPAERAAIRAHNARVQREDEEFLARMSVFATEIRSDLNALAKGLEGTKYAPLAAEARTLANSL